MTLCENITISNVVVSFTLNSKLCRDKLKTTFPSIKYPQRFSGGVLKYVDGCLLIFDSGRIIVTGVYNIAIAFTVIDRFCNRYPSDIKYIGLKIVNIVAYSRLKNDFNYEKLIKFPQYSYEPELFPGRHVKVDDTKVIVRIFRTGRITVTGIKDHESIKKYFDLFVSIYESI